MNQARILADSDLEHQAARRFAALVHLALRLIGRLPWPLLGALGAGLGRLAYLAGARGALIARLNIGYCFPELGDGARRALAEASLAASGRLAAESAWLIAHDDVDDLVTRVHGAHLLDELGRGGCLALVPHFGNWELLHAWIARRQRLYVMYRPPRQRWLRALLEEVRGARAKQPSHMVAATSAGVRTALRALRGGEVVAILPDQVPQRGGLVLPFFGHPARTMALPARLAITTGVPVAIGWAQRRADGRFEIHIERLDAARSSTADFMREVNAAIERIVRRAPEQYQWTYKRFKGQDQGRFRYYR